MMSKYRLMHLNRLRKVISENNQEYIFPCIEDLVENGLDLTRFSSEEHIPSRQDVTQYIAAWFKYTGLSADACREWMSEYSVDLLSAISSSSKSRIRHSTKSNIKYIYSSDKTFNCGCEGNALKAACAPTCPIYAEMTRSAEESKAAAKDKTYEIKPEDRVATEIAPSYSVKEQHRGQFEEAMRIAQQHLEQRVSRKEIVSLLNERGFKTRTGRQWTSSILAGELKKLNSDIDPADADAMSDRSL
jgi:hypothetical protein